MDYIKKMTIYDHFSNLYIFAWIQHSGLANMAFAFSSQQKWYKEVVVYSNTLFITILTCILKLD